MKESYLRQLKHHPGWRRRNPFWYDATLWEEHGLRYMVEVGWQRRPLGLTPVLVARILSVVSLDRCGLVPVFPSRQHISIFFPIKDRVATRLLHREPEYVWEVQPNLFADIHGD